MEGLLVKAGIAYLAWFYPGQCVQWFFAVVVAFIAAYFTTANAHWIAPFWPFIIWWSIDYTAFMVFTSWLFKQAKPQPQAKQPTINGRAVNSCANDNGIS